MTVPVMVEWIVQRYVKVPAVSKVRLTPCWLLMRPQSGPPSNVTVWVVAPTFAHVTVSPTDTVMLAGSKAKSTTSTALPIVIGTQPAAEVATGGASVGVAAGGAAGVATLVGAAGNGVGGAVGAAPPPHAAKTRTDHSMVSNFRKRTAGSSSGTTWLLAAKDRASPSVR